MSARHRINGLILCGVLIVAGIIGLATDSGWVFAIVAAGMLAAACASGDIRLR